jgi:hypothetical protein
MTESTPQPPESPGDDETVESTDESSSSSSTRSSTRSTGSGRFALYDKSLTRFVGPVVDSKSAANDKGLKVKGHTYEVREV